VEVEGHFLSLNQTQNINKNQIQMKRKIIRKKEKNKILINLRENLTEKKQSQ
jgi:hypothetical protein